MSITEDRSAEDALLYDDVTGLPNRLLQRVHLVHALRRATRHGTHVAVLYLEVEDLTDLRQRLGDELADQVLIVLGARITASLRGTDMTARVDRDEFAIVCEDLTDAHDLSMLSRRVSDVACTPMRIGDSVVELRVTVGTALSGAGDDATSLLRVASDRSAATRKARRGR
jgi:diguanylate cyclase (GGDEF)-like protein